VEDKEDGIPRSSNKARRDQDREKKGKGNVRLADSSRSQKYTEVLEISQLLSTIH